MDVTVTLNITTTKCDPEDKEKITYCNVSISSTFNNANKQSLFSHTKLEELNQVIENYKKWKNFLHCYYEIDIFYTKSKKPTDRNNELDQQYQKWKNQNQTVLGIRNNDVAERDPIDQVQEDIANTYSKIEESLLESKKELKKSIDQLLGNGGTDTFYQKFYDLIIKPLSEKEETHNVRLIIDTEDELLRQIPWELWVFFKLGQNYTKNNQINVALVLSHPESPVNLPSCSTIYSDLKPIILSCNLDIESVEKQRKIIGGITSDYSEITEANYSLEADFSLKTHKPNFLIIIGHNQDIKADVNYWNLNQEKGFGLQGNVLTEAIENGLKLLIFYSCDSHIIAESAAKMKLPHLIVMREKVELEITHIFSNLLFNIELDEQGNLKGYLFNYPLSFAVMMAQRELETMENGKYAHASCIPVLYQHPDQDLTAQDLGIDVDKLKKTLQQSDSKEPELDREDQEQKGLEASSFVVKDDVILPQEEGRESPTPNDNEGQELSEKSESLMPSPSDQDIQQLPEEGCSDLLSPNDKDGENSSEIVTSESQNTTTPEECKSPSKITKQESDFQSPQPSIIKRIIQWLCNRKWMVLIVAILSILGIVAAVIRDSEQPLDGLTREDWKIQDKGGADILLLPDNFIGNSTKNTPQDLRDIPAIVTASNTGNIEIRSITGKLLLSWKAHQNMINKILLTPNNSEKNLWLITAGKDSKTYAWNLTELIKLINSQQKEKEIDTATSNQYRQDVYTDATIKYLAFLEQDLNYNNSKLFRMALVTANSDLIIQDFNITDFQIIKTNKLPKNANDTVVNLDAIVALRDRYLLTALGTGEIAVWDLKNPEPKIVYKQNPQQNKIKSLQFSSNLNRLFSVGSNGTVKVWSVSISMDKSSNQPKISFNPIATSQLQSSKSENDNNDIALNLTQNTEVAALLINSTINLIKINLDDERDQKLEILTSLPLNNIKALDIRGFDVVALNNQGLVRVFNFEDLQKQSLNYLINKYSDSSFGFSGDIKEVQYLKDGQHLAILRDDQDDQQVTILNLQSPNIDSLITLDFNKCSNNDNIIDIAALSSSSQLLTLTEEKILCRWQDDGQLQAQQEIAKITLKSNELLESFEVNPNDQKDSEYAFYTTEKRLYFCDLSQQCNQLVSDDLKVKEFWFSPDGNYLIVRTSDQRVFIYKNGQPVITIKAVSLIAFSQHNSKIFALVTNQTLEINRLENDNYCNLKQTECAKQDENKTSLDITNNNLNNITNMSFSPDGEWLLLGDDQGKLCLWNYAKKTKCQHFAKNDDLNMSIKQVGFSPNGKLIFTVVGYENNDDDNNIVTVWDSQLNKIKEYKGYSQFFIPPQLSSNNGLVDFIICQEINASKDCQMKKIKPPD